MEIVNNIMNWAVLFYNNVVWNITLDAVIKFVVLYFFVIWWAFIIWVVKDITNRTTNIFLQIMSILVVILFTPIFGLPIYLLIRPRSTIFEKYYEEGEFEDDEIEMEEEIDEDISKNIYPCPKCWKDVSDDFRFCPYCEAKLIKECSKCGKEIKIDRKVCPYCGNHQENTKTKKDVVKVEVVKSPKKKTIKEIVEKIKTEE